MKIDLFDNILAFFVLLTCFVCLQVGPSNECLAALAKDVAHGMQSRNQSTFFTGPNRHVDTLIKQIGAPVTPMKALGNDVIVTRQVRTALATRVDLRTVEVDHGVVHSLCITRPCFGQGVVQ